MSPNFAFVPSIAALTDRLTIGAWHDDDAASFGPLVSSDIAKSVVTNAGALAGKGALTVRESRISDRGGAFVEPGIYDVTGVDVPDEEIFGPVLQIIRAANWDEAIAIANDSSYGLSAGVLTRDAAKGFLAARRIKAGSVHIGMHPFQSNALAPIGGYKMSGIGKSGGHYSTHEFTELKWVSLETGLP